MKEYVGGYSDWLRQKTALVAEAKGDPVTKRRAAEPERAAVSETGWYVVIVTSTADRDRRRCRAWLQASL